MSEVSESLLMEGWCSPETTKNITDSFLESFLNRNENANKILELRWRTNGLEDSTRVIWITFMVFFCPFWSLTGFAVLSEQQQIQPHKLTKGLIRATEAAQDQTRAAMENQDRLCFYLLPVPKKMT